MLNQTKRTLRALCLVALLGSTCTASANAAFGITEVGAKVTSRNTLFSNRAGAHADVTTRLVVNTKDNGIGGVMADDNLRDVKFDLPPGFVGNPTTMPTCGFDQLIAEGTTVTNCPIASQVGVAYLTFSSPNGPYPVYNMVRPGNAPALFAMNILATAITFQARVRPGDYGVSVDSITIPTSLSPLVSDVTFWGVPADGVHDPLRWDPKVGFGADSPDLPKPFLNNPTSCPRTPATFTASIDSWQNPGAWFAKSLDRDLDGTPFIFTGCDAVPFDPSVDLRPLSQVAAAPLGFDIGLEVPQSDSAEGIASAHVRKTVVTFPKGMSVSPASAAGQGACSEAQIGIGSEAAPTCPDSSRVGTVRIETPLLDEELDGSLYLAEQGKNPFGSLLAAYLAVKGPGFYLKLPGKIEADPADGQLTATFDNQPQLPYEKVSISLRGGPGAPLVAPPACGTYTTKIEMTSWASPIPVTLDAPIKIDENCGGGFNPDLKAGTTDPVAGAFSPILLRLTRSDGEQNVARVDATLPEGLLAKLAGVPLCADAAAVTGACPAASQIGAAIVAVGAGPTPLYVPQPGKAPTAIYLAGPYRGAPYSLVVKVPAQAGPFDLGTVAVRSGIDVDPVSTQVSVKSEPLPQILQGIPIAYRDIRVEVNRPDFTLNPTGCASARIAATVASAQGAIASPSVRFGVAGCRELGFKPKLALSLKGGTNRGRYPALRAVLTPRRGDANIGRVSVALPHSEFLAQNHIRTVCTRVQFAAGAGNGSECPKGSIYGRARAITPLLDQPLSGPVYLRSSSNPLPDMVIALHGQIDVDLVGRIDSKNGGIRTTFASVPDAPVSKFVLTMQGGRKGLLENSRDLCASTHRAGVQMDAHNGRVHDSGAVLVNGCKHSRRR